ncbi:MAG: hypothetical protein V4536_01525 [Pseudomonadota bacterium]
MNNTLGTIESMFALRAWCRDNLPTDNSLIAYDLILLIAIAGEKKQQLTIKQLFSSLPHSYTAVRQHYNRFIREGWLAHQSDEKDGRIKYIQPTDKFRQTVKNYSNAANHIFLNKPQ